MISTASAPAKIILLGEHAVVHGHPALAAPVSALRAAATVTPNAPGESGLRIVAGETVINLPADIQSQTVQDALALTARLVLEAADRSAPNWTITIESAIPIASGLGSGAAVSAAVGRAVALSVGRTIADSDLNALVYEVERLHHGTPSGIDNTVIVYERPVYFVRDQILETFSVGSPVMLLVADTGKRALTRDSVGDVRKLYDSQPELAQPAIRAIGEVVRQARAALIAGDLPRLGALADENHLLLQTLTVSSPELDTLVQAARAAGALGAKLSGGGRGGNMIAFVQPETAQPVEAALRQAGAVNVSQTIVS